MHAMPQRCAAPAALRLVPIGDLDCDLAFVQAPLEALFGCGARIEAALPLALPSDAAEGRRRDASRLMRALNDRYGAGEDKVIGVTADDLYAPGLAWVFGQAQLRGPAAVVSTHRLRERFHGRVDDGALERRRLLTEVAHEVGHLFGLGHCAHPSCCMRRSATLDEIEAKGSGLCRACRCELARLRSDTAPRRAWLPLGRPALAG